MNRKDISKVDKDLPHKALGAWTPIQNDIRHTLHQTVFTGRARNVLNPGPDLPALVRKKSALASDDYHLDNAWHGFDLERFDLVRIYGSLLLIDICMRFSKLIRFHS